MLFLKLPDTKQSSFEQNILMLLRFINVCLKVDKFNRKKGGKKCTF